MPARSGTQQTAGIGPGLSRGRGDIRGTPPRIRLLATTRPRGWPGPAYPRTAGPIRLGLRTRVWDNGRVWDTPTALARAVCRVSPPQAWDWPFDYRHRLLSTQAQALLAGTGTCRHRRSGGLPARTVGPVAQPCRASARLNPRRETDRDSGLPSPPPNYPSPAQPSPAPSPPPTGMARASSGEGRGRGGARAACRPASPLSVKNPPGRSAEGHESHDEESEYDAHVGIKILPQSCEILIQGPAVAAWQGP